MKLNLVLVSASAVVIASAAIAWQQRERAQDLEQQIAALTAAVQQRSAEANEQQEAAKRLKAENDAYTNEASTLRKKLVALNEPALIPPPTVESGDPPSPKKNGMGEFLNKILKDPKMKEMMRKQQGAALKQMYGDFIKSKGMTAQQAEQFFNLLDREQMGAIEDSMSALNGEGGLASPPEGGASISAEARAETDRQLKMLLGDGGYANYKDYQKTIGERMALVQVQQQFSANSMPLGTEQASSLLQVMIEERAKTPPSAFEVEGNEREKIRALTTSNAGERFYQTQSDLNQRILNRAGGILKPEQYSALESFQKQQLEMQKFGMEMARTMIGDEKN